MTPAAQHRQSPLGLFPDRPAPRLYDRIVEQPLDRIAPLEQKPMLEVTAAQYVDQFRI